ncbi:MAG: translation elongation factor Ts [Acidimicrobiales bacterium]
MPEFTGKDVQLLRQASGAGMMDAKRALTETGGDHEAAARWLREKGLGKADSRGSRDNTQGAVAISVDGRVAAIVELKCETDFVAKSDGFVAAAQELADAIAADGEGAVDDFKDAVDDLKITLKENIEVGQTVRIDAADGNVLDTYLHRQDGRGVNAVAVELAGGTQEVAHDLAVHIAFTKPHYLTRDDVPAEVIDAERQVLEAQTRQEGKPEAALTKIVDGKLGGWLKEHVLLEQKWVRDEKQTIRDLLDSAGADLVRFAQVYIGS